MVQGSSKNGDMNGLIIFQVLYFAQIPRRYLKIYVKIRMPERGKLITWRVYPL